MPRTTKSATANIDKHIGSRIRTRRVLLGLAMQDIAGLIGVSYQQEAKYENGTNRVSAATLYKIARVFSVDLDYFFYGLDGASEITDPPPGVGRDDNLRPIGPAHQSAVSHLARALASAA